MAFKKLVYLLIVIRAQSLGLNRTTLQYAYVQYSRAYFAAESSGYKEAARESLRAQHWQRTGKPTNCPFTRRAEPLTNKVSSYSRVPKEIPVEKAAAGRMAAKSSFLRNRLSQDETRRLEHRK